MTSGESVRTRIATMAVPVALLAGLLACIHGVYTYRQLLAPPWDRPASSRTVAVLIAAGLIALAGLARRYRWPALPVFGAALLAIAATFAGLGPALVVVLQILAALSLGRRLYPNTGGDHYEQLLWGVIATAIGLALLSVVVGVSSFFPINNPGTYLLLLAAPVLIGARANLAALRELGGAALAGATAPGRWTSALWLVLAFSVMLRLLSVLHPELGTDALAMHLAIADQVRTEGRFHYDVTRAVWAVMPMAGDWQFTIANMLGGEYAARLLNLVADLLVVAGIYLVCARHRGALAGLVAAVVYSTLPLVYLETTALFIENFWTLWLFGGLLAGVASLGSGGFRAAASAGLLVGTAVAAKVLTVFAAPFFFVIAAAWLLASARDGLRRLAAFTGVALAAAVLPYANAWLRTGNPVFPFMNEIFRSPFYESGKSFDNTNFASGFDWTTLYRATFESGKYLESQPGAIGLALMTLLPAALLYALFDSRRARWAAICTVLFIAGVFSFTSYLRYLLPVMPVMAMLVGIMVAAVVEQSPRLKPALLAVVLACGLAGLYLTPNAGYHHRSIAIPPFADSRAERDYRLDRRPERQVARVIDSLGLRKVLWLGTSQHAQSNAEVHLVDWHGGYAQRVQYWGLTSKQQLASWIAGKRFDGIVVASGVNPCERQFFCDFLDEGTTLVFERGNARLYLPRQELQFTRERLSNPGFDRDTAGWGGTGRFNAQAGAVQVTTTEPYFQQVAVEGGGRYLLEVEGRCSVDKAPYRSQVNWIDGAGVFLSTSIAVVPCTEAFRTHEAIVVAPPEARAAIVYASGHEAAKSAEITRISFRSP